MKLLYLVLMLRLVIVQSWEVRRWKCLFPQARFASRGCSTSLLHMQSSSKSPEEQLDLRVSIQSKGFLNNILEYGNHRMARRAVGILQKMPTYRINPSLEHFNAALWACEKSEQYKLALSVFEDMKKAKINVDSSSYEALISVYEKTGQNELAIDFFNEMRTKNITLITASGCINALWAYANLGKAREANLLLRITQELQFANATFFTACIIACDRGRNATLALELLREMKANFGIDNIPSLAYNAAIWACVKDHHVHETFDLLHEMQLHNIPRTTDTFNAVIWACELLGEGRKAEQYRQRMLIEKIDRNMMTYDGIFSALNKMNAWETMLEVLRSMEREPPAVAKSAFTYKVLLECLGKNKQMKYSQEIFAQALKEGYYNPWVKSNNPLVQSVVKMNPNIDLRGFNTMAAKLALRTVLMSMFEGRLNIFSLYIATGNAVQCSQNEAVEVISSFDVDELMQYLESEEFIISSNISKKARRKVTLHIDRVIEGKIEKLLIANDTLHLWKDFHQ